MSIIMEPAVRSQAKIKLAMSGTSGSGKTLSSLLLGYGLVKAANPGISDDAAWAKICIIDTENRSGSLYQGYDRLGGGLVVGSYQKINLSAPFTPAVYIQAIDVAERGGIEFLIIDSLSHAWQGEGGMLDIQGAVTKRVGNSYTAWREVTPLHNRLVDKILQCNMHVCLTMRSKTEYVLDDDERGRKVPRKVGMAPVFRDGIEFETTLFFEIAQDHTASATKDRTGLFDGQYFVISPKTGEVVWKWLESGAVPTEPAVPVIPDPAPASRDEYVEAAASEITPEQIEAMGYDELMSAIVGKYDSIKDRLTPNDKRALAKNIKTITNSNSANFKTLGEDKVPELRALLSMFITDYIN